MPNEIKVEKTIYELLQEVRNELFKTNLKKSGKGNTGKRDYEYFELADFLPTTVKLFFERGMCPIISIGYDANGVEVCKMRIVKGNEEIVFSAPTAESMTSSNPIQNLGAKITYMRRYMYMMALDLVENDIVEISDNENLKGKETVAEKKATEKQVSKIKSLYDEENQAKIVAYYKVEKLEDLSIQIASELIKRKDANGASK